MFKVNLEVVKPIYPVNPCTRF